MGFQCKREGDSWALWRSWKHVAVGLLVAKWQGSVVVGIAPVRDCWLVALTMGVPWEKASVMEVENGARAAWGLWSLRITHITG